MGDEKVSERATRRVLYAAAGLAWGASTVLAIHAAATESVLTRTATMFALAMAVALTSASLLAVFVAPLERIYRHGYEAGLREQASEPQALPRAVGHSGVVIPLRPVRLDVRSDC